MKKSNLRRQLVHDDVLLVEVRVGVLRAGHRAREEVLAGQRVPGGHELQLGHQHLGGGLGAEAGDHGGRVGAAGDAVEK